MLEKLRIVDKNKSLVETLQTVFTQMSSDPINRTFFQHRARPRQPASSPGRTKPFLAPNFSSGSKRHDKRRNRSWDRDRYRDQRSHNIRGGKFHSERLTRSTSATTYGDDEDVDTEPSMPPLQQDDSDGEADKCPVCLDTIKQPRRLKCKHTFCQKCLDESAKHQGQTCPVCKEPFGKGRRARTMPPGTMDVRFDRATRIPGYPDANGSIIITYNFTSGTQSVSLIYFNISNLVAKCIYFLTSNVDNYMLVLILATRFWEQ